VPLEEAESSLPRLPNTRNALRDLFTDLMAYTLFFQASCAHRPLELGEVRDKVTGLIDESEKRARGGEVRWEGYTEARFAVLSWVDELIMTSAWPQRGQWQHLMLKYYQTVNAGKQFFERLERVPVGARDIREIYYICLALGFQGKYALADDPRQLGELRRTLYNELSGAPNDIRRSYARLFPEAYRKPPTIRPPQSHIRPVWFGIAIFAPVLLFAVYYVLLREQASALLARIDTPVAAAPPLAVDWARSLVEELRRRGIEARDTPRGVVITLPGVLFELSRSDLGSDGERRIEEVARALKRHAPERLVAVEGHASREKGTLDDQNQRLSEDRARKVADLLVSLGLRPDRVTAKGLGSSTPVASNDTEAGRRLNRRVEMIVERSGN